MRLGCAARCAVNRQTKPRVTPYPERRFPSPPPVCFGNSETAFARIAPGSRTSRLERDGRARCARRRTGGAPGTKAASHLKNRGYRDPGCSFRETRVGGLAFVSNEPGWAIGDVCRIVKEHETGERDSRLGRKHGRQRKAAEDRARGSSAPSSLSMNLVIGRSGSHFLFRGIEDARQGRAGADRQGVLPRFTEQRCFHAWKDTTPTRSG